MKKLDLEDVKIDDLIRYQHCMRDFNHYSKANRITKKYIVLEDGIKFKKESGWGTGYHDRYLICGINDQKDYRKDDEMNLFYY